jgi:hypothetical protein
LPLLLAALCSPVGRRALVRRRSGGRAPQIDAARGAAPAVRPQPPAAAGEPLQVSLEPLRLSLTLMNATLAYRLELANRGPAR